MLILLIQNYWRVIINKSTFSNFSVTVGGAYFGVLGMFLAVPIFTVIKLLIEEYIEYKSSTI